MKNKIIHILNVILSYLFSIASIIYIPISYFIKKQDYLSIVATIKDEAPYILEWIEYHKLVGVQRFYLYDAGTDNTRELLDPYIKSGEVIYKYEPYRACQIPVYNDAIARCRLKTRWLAIIDADEFIAPIKNEAIPEFLRGFEKYPGVVANWIMYDYNQHITKPNGLVIKNYTNTHENINHGDNHLIKSIINERKALFCISPHFVYYIGLGRLRFPVDENKNRFGRGFSPKTNTVTKQNHTDFIRICHYHCKSKEEYIKKLNRGNADSYEKRAMVEELWKFPDPKQDLTMEKYVPILEEKYFNK